MIPRQFKSFHEDPRSGPVSPKESMGFLPELKMFRNDEGPMHLRKRSDLRIPLNQNLLKISAECKPRVIELSRDVNRLSEKDFYDNYSFKNH